MHEEITSLLNVELSFNHYQHFGFGREKFSFFLGPHLWLMEICKLGFGLET